MGRLEIRGTEILSPGGKHVSGAYDRHASRYVVLTGEPRPGAEVDMALVDDDTIHRIVAASADAKIEVWHRCQAPVSWQPGQFFSVGNLLSPCDGVA